MLAVPASYTWTCDILCAALEHFMQGVLVRYTRSDHCTPSIYVLVECWHCNREHATSHMYPTLWRNEQQVLFDCMSEHQSRVHVPKDDISNVLKDTNEVGMICLMNNHFLGYNDIDQAKVQWSNVHYSCAKCVHLQVSAVIIDSVAGTHLHDWVKGSHLWRSDDLLEATTVDVLFMDITQTATFYTQARATTTKATISTRPEGQPKCSHVFHNHKYHILERQ